MFKKLIIFSFIITLCVYGFTFDKKATVSPKLIQQENGNQWCPVSGDKIEDYYKTSYIAKLQMNGNNRQYCSIRCLVMDMQEYGIDLKSIKVVDVVSQKYIQASDAYFVVGSKVDGSLSQKSKLAFSTKGDALEFMKSYKGTLMNFTETLNLAKNSLQEENEILKKIKIKKTYPRGKKIFEKVCQKDSIDPTNYIEINELKQDIVDKKLCKPLKEKDLHALALYIWEVKRFGDLDTIENKVKVNEDEKCPVCGMFTYKYPRWAAQIFYEKGEHKHHWSFDGVKDLMKFYFDSAKWGNYPIAKKENIVKILVTDYYSQKGIDGTKAYFVIRSDIYGPMGHEFIPFESLSDAKTFKKDHFGKKIIQFSDIIEDGVYQLDFNE
jgi:nitrous oxide reductase accessory protein NosL